VVMARDATSRSTAWGIALLLAITLVAAAAG
jgi:hypothetical protein